MKKYKFASVSKTLNICPYVPYSRKIKQKSASANDKILYRYIKKKQNRHS